MNFEGHLVCSIFIYTIAYFFISSFSIGSFIVYGLVFVFFGLFPDIDTNSKIQDWFYAVLIVLTGYLLITKAYYAAAVLGFLALFPIASKHRGLTHSLYTGVLIAYFVYLVCGHDYSIWTFGGFLCHRLCDLEIFSHEVVVH